MWSHGSDTAQYKLPLSLVSHQLYELGVDGGDNETDGELLAETEEVSYECGAR